MAEKISKTQIIKAALDLLNEFGIEKLTMRALAKRLNIKAASLYWHVSSKQILLEAMAEEIIKDITYKIDVDQDYQNMLVDLAIRFRIALLHYRDGCKVFAGTFVLTGNILNLPEVGLASLLKANFSTQDAADIMFNFSHYITGFVAEEQGFNAQMANKTDAELQKLFSYISAEEFPSVTQCLDDILNRDFDRRFNFGIKIFLNGLKSL